MSKHNVTFAIIQTLLSQMYVETSARSGTQKPENPNFGIQTQ